MSDLEKLYWQEKGEAHFAQWRSERGLPPPRKLIVADDTLSCERAFRWACEGGVYLWRGDFHNAKQLLHALARRMAVSLQKHKHQGMTPTESFHRYRQSQAQRARVLGSLLIPLTTDFRIPLRRAPDVALACKEVYSHADQASVLALTELQGIVGAHEWRKKGVPIPALGARIFPHYGVFSPVRGEYIDLLAELPLPKVTHRAFDIGTGTGVLAAVLIRRGVERVVATDCDLRAVRCAADNLQRLGIASQVELLHTRLFPEGRADLIVCNPPWLPARPSSPIECAVYDPGSQMLKTFLNGVSSHLNSQGEAWLVLSDLAEHLGLRSLAELLALFQAAGLRVIARHDTAPRHRKSQDTQDPLYWARSAERTTIWRLGM